MRNNTSKKTLVVTRNCCTSGNCFTCSRPLTAKRREFTPIRIEHWRGTDKVRANELVRNWAAYAARIES